MHVTNQMVQSWLTLLCTELYERIREFSDYHNLYPKSLAVSCQHGSHSWSKHVACPPPSQLSISRLAQAFLSVLPKDISGCARLSINASGFGQGAVSEKHSIAQFMSLKAAVPATPEKAAPLPVVPAEITTPDCTTTIPQIHTASGLPTGFSDNDGAEGLDSPRSVESVLSSHPSEDQANTASPSLFPSSPGDPLHVSGPGAAGLAPADRIALPSSYQSNVVDCAPPLLHTSMAPAAVRATDSPAAASLLDVQPSVPAPFLAAGPSPAGATLTHTPEPHPNSLSTVSGHTDFPAEECPLCGTVLRCSNMYVNVHINECLRKQQFSGGPTTITAPAPSSVGSATKSSKRQASRLTPHQSALPKKGKIESFFHK